MTKLLVGVDLEDVDGMPVRWANKLSEWAGFPVELVHVVEKVPAEVGVQILRAKHPDALDHLMEEAGTELRERLRDWGIDEVDGDPTLRIGRPSRELTAYAEKVGDCVLVLGAGRRRWVESLLGTTTDRVLRMSKVPVLVARGVPERKPSRLLVAVDCSENAAGVLAAAGRWARGIGAGVTVYHVPQPRWRNAFLEGRGEDVRDEMFEGPEEMRARSRKEVETMVAAHLADGKVEFTIELGEPGEAPPDAIAARLEGGEVGLLLTGTHGTGGVDRLILGSVTESLTRRSPVPVLVIPGE